MLASWRKKSNGERELHLGAAMDVSFVEKEAGWEERGLQLSIVLLLAFPLHQTTSFIGICLPVVHWDLRHGNFCDYGAAVRSWCALFSLPVLLLLLLL